MKANLANRPSIERIREALNYDPITGVLTWRITSGRAYAGKEAGCFDKSSGYIRVRIDGHFILAHHVGWAIHQETSQSENVKAGYMHMRAGTAPLYRRKKIA